MNYALVENGVVINVIWLHPKNADEFPNAVAMGDVPAGIGDTWDGEHFYRDGEQVLTAAELAALESEDMQAALALLGVTIEGTADAVPGVNAEEAEDAGATSSVEADEAADADAVADAVPGVNAEEAEGTGAMSSVEAGEAADADAAGMPSGANDKEANG